MAVSHLRRPKKKSGTEKDPANPLGFLPKTSRDDPRGSRHARSSHGHRGIQKQTHSTEDALSLERSARRLANQARTDPELYSSAIKTAERAIKAAAHCANLRDQNDVMKRLRELPGQIHAKARGTSINAEPYELPADIKALFPLIYPPKKANNEEILIEAATA